MSQAIMEAGPAGLPAIDAADHLGLVTAVALRFHGRGVPLDDLIGEGRVGLVRACGTFDPGHGTPFPAYAYKCIFTAIVRASRELRGPIRVPRSATECDESNPNHRGCRHAARLAWGAGGGDAVESVADAEDAVPEVAARREAAAAVLARMRLLTARERAVIVRRFGLDGGAPDGLREIAESFGVSKERIRQIEARALARLKGDSSCSC